jgi:hypothetical protein
MESGEPYDYHPILYLFLGVLSMKPIREERIKCRKRMHFGKILSILYDLIAGFPAYTKI